jgi:hypothetical protein
MEYVSQLPLQRVQSLLKREDSRFMIATEKLLLLSQMNSPMPGISTDNDC